MIDFKNDFYLFFEQRYLKKYNKCDLEYFIYFFNRRNEDKCLVFQVINLKKIGIFV